MPYRVDDYQIALEAAPECARRIGLIFGLYVLIEYELVPTLRWVANISPEQARIALESHKQFTGKVAYIRAVCDANQPDWPRDEEIGRAFAAAALTASKLRNTYAHATYGWSGDPTPAPAAASAPEPEQLTVRVVTNALTGNAREAVATLGQLDAEVRFMKSLIVAMKNYAEARVANTPVDHEEIRSLVRFAPEPFLRSP